MTTPNKPLTQEREDEIRDCADLNSAIYPHDSWKSVAIDLLSAHDYWKDRADAEKQRADALAAELSIVIEAYCNHRMAVYNAYNAHSNDWQELLRKTDEVRDVGNKKLKALAQEPAAGTCGNPNCDNGTGKAPEGEQG